MVRALAKLVPTSHAFQTRLAAVGVLVERLYDDPQIKEFLHDLARWDRNPLARVQVMSVLAHHRARDPAVRDLIIEAAKRDRNRYARDPIMSLLSHYYRRDPEAQRIWKEYYGRLFGNDLKKRR